MAVNRKALGQVAVLIVIMILIGNIYFTNQQLLLLTRPVYGVWGAVPIASYSSGDIQIDGLSGDVKVYYDSYGVPYIEATNYRDLAMVFGYIQAKDRLFQMDLARRAGSGRLSALFGKDFVETDKFYKIIGMHRAAENTLKYLKESHQFDPILGYLEAFTRGVNQYIKYAIRNNELPVEYRILGVEPEEWKVTDTLIIGKLVGWGLSGGFEDLELKSFLDANGYDALIDLDLLNRSLNTPILLRYNFSVSKINTLTSEPLPHDDIERLLDLYYQAEGIVRFFFGEGLSNNWVISGNLTENGYPILANDPHLSLQVPPVWYEATLIIPGELHVRGVTFPGIPLIIIGRNDKVAWGFTNVGADVVDFYYYKWKDNKYLYNGSYHSPVSVPEDIVVRTNKGYEDIPFTVNMTIHGPLYEYNNTRYALRWTGNEVTLELIAFYYFSMARDVHEFIEAQKYFGVPAQNAVIADTKGNIAYYPAGLYPIRDPLPEISVNDKPIINSGFLPFNGSNGEGEWIGYIPFEEIPHAINPKQGFIVTANNKVVGPDYPYYLTWDWSDRYRHDRIKGLIFNILSEKGRIGVQDVAIIQGDVHSYAAQVMIPLLLKHVDLSKISRLARQAYDILDGWDYDMRVDLVAPTIYHSWLYVLDKELWSDELDAAGIERLTFFPLEVTEWVLREASAGNGAMIKWMDEDISTLVTSSLEQAVDLLNTSLGSDVEKWKWGELHRYAVSHPIGAILNWLNYPVYPAPGGLFTVNVAVSGLQPPNLIVMTAPSIRFIADLSPDGASLMILPGGNNGNPFSRNYHDQLETYIKVGYKEMIIPNTVDDLNNIVVRLMFHG